MSSCDAPNFRSNQKTMNVVTTNPPANASSANSELSVKTVLLERSSGRWGRRWPLTSTSDESERASTRQASAPRGKSSSHR